MGQVDILKYREAYKKLNRSFKPVLVFHLGAGAGFFSEYNNMILTMLYCLEHKIQFKLYSKDANFGVSKGWTDFFEPFCEEVYNSFHSELNYRDALPSYRKILNQYKGIDLYRFFKWKIKILFCSIFVTPFFKRISGVDYLTYDVFNKARVRSLEQQHFCIPELGINGSLQQACSRLIEITWCYQKHVKREVDAMIHSLHLPEVYVSLHVRGGDKYQEASIQPVEVYMERLRLLSSEKEIFMLTDDYTNITNLKTKYPEYTVYTFCEEHEHGYYHASFCQQDVEYRRTHLIRLFASIDIISDSELFIGTYSSNPGMYLGCRIQEKMIGVDNDKWFIM